MKFSDLNFKVITNTSVRNNKMMTTFDKINRTVKDKDAFKKALFVEIFEGVATYWNNCGFELFDSLESKEITFEEAIKLLESCEPEVKEQTGKFVEYDIDENGCYHPLNDRGSSSICRWQDIHHYEDVNRIFGGCLWVHPDKPRNNCWSTSRMGIWNNELTTTSHIWEYPLMPKKIRFWVKE